MDGLWNLLGVLLLLYVGQCLMTGSVYSKYRAWGRIYLRDEQPFHYWSTIATYCLLSLALFFVF
jgi:hypothetical protein